MAFVGEIGLCGFPCWGPDSIHYGWQGALFSLSIYEYVKKCCDLLDINILLALISSPGAVVVLAKALWKFTREN